MHSLSGQEAAVSFQQNTSGHRGIQPYTHPGIVSYKAGRWIGNDHLFNLSNEISVIVETILPLNYTEGATADSIRKRVESHLRNAGIDPFSSSDGVAEVLPFIHVLILVYPIDDAYISSVSIRLLESVDLPRVQIEQGVVWQAVTWEKQKLLRTPTGQHVQQVDAAIDSIIGEFVKRFLFYKKLKEYLEKRE
ncbi:Uncharacterized protein SCG7086_AF_00220 [Chlamydiales bacterium SCGC AG-110-P3]|nr:Uncharacterized protein SCG7086_AF_00220 [Chlamydiales bacterium SCGC AG-110-P3]